MPWVERALWRYTGGTGGACLSGAEVPVDKLSFIFPWFGKEYRCNASLTDRGECAPWPAWDASGGTD